MPRFTDIEKTPTRLTPVYGYLTAPLLPLHKALEPISSQIDQLDRFSKIAKNECHYPSEHGLTRDESAAVFLYTMEWGDNSFYQVINRALRAEDRSTLKPWFTYLKLFDTAAQKLPTVRKNVWRGIKNDVSRNFKVGDEFTWWTISSCSTSVNVIKEFLGLNSTLFLIEAVNGKDVSKYTNYQNEHEVILCPGTRLRVVSDPLDQPPIHLVHLKEVTDDNEDQLTNSFSTMSTTSSPKNASNSQFASIQIHTDEEGNRYEGEMKDGKKHGKGRMDFANGYKVSVSGLMAIAMSENIQKLFVNQTFITIQNSDNFAIINEQLLGQWKDGKKHGKGTFTWAPESNGLCDKYTGHYIDGVRTGQGVYVYANGDRYEGQWKDGKKHGKGTFTWAPEANGLCDKYTGHYIDGVRTGQGVCVYANGDRYEGQWKDGKKHGKGTFTWAPEANGLCDKYTGHYIDGVRTGQGVYVYANGDRYEGQWKDGKKHGKGTFTWAPEANGLCDKYTGHYIDGVRTGQGVCVYANGDRYEGQWKDGKKHGKGTFTWGPNTKWAGDKYTGRYIDGVRTGQGVYVYANGDRYEGQWKDGKKHGKGTFTWGPNTKWAGDKYTGRYIDGVRTGQGVYVYANGDRYEGQWKDGKKHGKGTFTWAPEANGLCDKYTGHYIDDFRTGQGVYVYANGDRYEGEWEDGNFHGKGKMTYANGTIKDGMWSNGEFIR